MRRYAKLWILPLVLVLVALAARRVASASWNSLVHFRPPQFSVEPGGRAEPVGRVALVVVDGLRVDAVENMEYLSALKNRSAFYILKSGQPSLSYPGSAVIATGAWQDVTGVTTNWFEGPVRRDSLFSLARGCGRSAVLVGEEGWGKLFGDQAARTYTRAWRDAYTTFDEDTLAKALEFLSEKPDLAVIHFVDVDEAGHDFGAASAEYRRNAAHIDRLIARLHAALDGDMVLIVTSDHGQLDRGGHGGGEDMVTRVPFLMSGRPVRPGSYGSARQADVAPTVAALAGLPVPPYSQGRILDEALELGAQKVRLEALQSAQKREFTRAYLGAVGADFEVVRRKVPPVPGETGPAYWGRVLSAGKEARLAAGMVSRLPLFLAVLLLPAAALWYFGKRSGLPPGPALGAAILFFAADYALFFASGKFISLSAINEEDMLPAFLNQTMLYAAVSLVAMAVLLAFLNRKKTAREAAGSSLLMTAIAAFLIVAQVDFFFLYNGPLIAWHIPDMFLGFKYYLDLMSLIAVGFVSVLIPVVTLGAHRFWRWTGL